MPWAPELFSAPALQHVLDKRRRERLRSMPFFDGLLSGEVDALLGSFAGAPLVDDPLRGRIAGEDAFRRYAAEMTAWMAARHVEVQDVNVLLTGPRGVEEVVLHLDGDGGRVGLPLALVADHDDDARIVALRLYCSTLPLTGRRARRAPLLAPDPDLQVPADVVAGVAVEPCAVTDDGRAWALEYNIASPPQPGLAVHVRDAGATRVYDDVERAERG